MVCHPLHPRAPRHDTYSLSPTDSASSDDDMDMDAFGDDFKIPQRVVRKAYEIDHESLSQSAVEELMSNDIAHISGIFGVEVRIHPHFQYLQRLHYPRVVTIVLTDMHGSASLEAHELEQRAAH